MIYIAFMVAGIVIGIVGTILWQFFHAQGHAVFGVKNKLVQDLLEHIIKMYTGLKPRTMINSGPTHQLLFSDGTVVAYFDDSIAPSLPKNVRSFVVQDPVERRQAANDLVRGLKDRGFQATIQQPLLDFPRGTFLLVTSTGFLDCGFAFRPSDLTMMRLEKQVARTRAA